MSKKKRRRKALLYIIPAVILIAVLIIAVFQALRIYIPQTNEKNRFDELKQLADVSQLPTFGSSPATPQATDAEQPLNDGLKELRQLNSDFVGWLRVPETDIDYPVMKPAESDPEFYLHRDFDKNDSFSGCLFFGEGCDEDSDVTVIYGHNMNNDTMFGTLDRFYSADFAFAHRDIVLQTPNENRLYRVFAAFQTKIFRDETDRFQYYNAVGQQSGESYEEIVENIRAMSGIDLADAPQYPAQILFLSTCSYHTDDGRFVVAAYRVG